jgi:hypothetical protein
LLRKCNGEIDVVTFPIFVLANLGMGTTSAPLIKDETKRARSALSTAGRLGSCTD